MSFDVNKNLCILWCSTVHGNLLKQEEKVSAAQVNLGLHICKDVFDFFVCSLFPSANKKVRVISTAAIFCKCNCLQAARTLPIKSLL